MSTLENKNTANASHIDDIKYKIGLSKVATIGPKRLSLLLNYFGSAQNAWSAARADLEQSGLDDRSIDALVQARSSLNLDALLETLAKENIRTTMPEQDDYPPLLNEIYDPPPILYYRGALPKEHSFSIAVVGTRKNTPYGKIACEQIVAGLVRSTIVIASGLAYGIDAIAHQATLDAAGTTIAILGASLEKNNIYPAHNRSLAERIAESGGALVSEHPPGTPPLKQYFPRRNRIISGISLGVLVVEAPEQSGALLTARYALEQDRDVFAVPGNITSENSLGTNNLIKMGARPVSEAEDILSALNLERAEEYSTASDVVPNTREEAVILDSLTKEPLHVDDIARLTKLAVRDINAALTLMEMKGMVRHMGGMRYCLAR